MTSQILTNLSAQVCGPKIALFTKQIESGDQDVKNLIEMLLQQCTLQQSIQKLLKANHGQLTTLI